MFGFPRLSGPSCTIAAIALLVVSDVLLAGETTLPDAAERADWVAVRELLNSALPNQKQADGMTALHWSAYHDNVEVSKELLRRKATADAKNRYGITPLSIACVNGNATLVAALLDAGANANEKLHGGETMLMLAARTGNSETVNALLRSGAEVDASDRKRQTAIMWASAEGHADVVAMLLRAGAEFQSQLKSGFNPMFFAVREGRTDVVRELLSAGSDVNQVMDPQSKGGRIARSGTSPLLLAIENGHFGLAVRLLEAGGDPNDQRSGFTPLHAITWVRKPNLGDGVDGDPPPIGSGSVTSLQLVRKLVEHGADVNARLSKGRSGRGRVNQVGATPFLFACDTADVPLMRLLLDLGADPTIPNEDDCPPILPAAGYGTLAPGEEAGTEEESLAAVELLLNLGADINAVDRNGETAMHGAAYASFPRMVAYLVDRGAEINIWNRENRHGWTPLLIAEGYRPGNFKPAAATIDAVRAAMIAGGVQPPDGPTPRKRPNQNDAWDDDAIPSSPAVPKPAAQRQ